MRSSLKVTLLAVMLLSCIAMPVFAQEAAPMAPSADGQIAGGVPATLEEPALEIPNYNPRDYVPLGALMPDGKSVQVTDELIFQSLLFTPEDINTVITTLNRRARSAASSNVGTGFVGGQLGDAGEGVDGEEPVVRPYYPPIPTKRVISVSGMIYRKPGDWIVWINGHKLVPGSRLPELVDIKVERDRVHLKWFDIGMAKILTITLRPRQTYDITSGVLLNTTGGEIQ